MSERITWIKYWKTILKKIFFNIKKQRNKSKRSFKVQVHWGPGRAGEEDKPQENLK